MIVIPRLPSVFNGLTLLQISDLHFYEYSKASYYAMVADRINALNPDILILTGDVIHFGSDYLAMAGSFLESLKAKEAKLAILGNHDYTDGAQGQKLAQILKQSGFHLLQNTAISLTRNIIDQQSQWGQTDQTGETNPDHRLWFAGLDDLWYGKPNIPHTLVEIPPEETVIMLAHNPLLFDPIALTVPGRVDLVLSGHTHAGHVYIPILGPIYRRIFRMKYRYGHYVKNGCQMVVSSGIGSAAFYLKKQQIAFPPFRWNTEPEMVLIRLSNGN